MFSREAVLKEIDKLDERPWDIRAALRDLQQRLIMLDFYQNNIVIDYEDIQPDHVVTGGCNVS